MSAAVIMDRTPEASPRFEANVAGGFYLTSILTAGAAAFARSRLVVPGDATATAANILSHAPLFRMLFAADLISAACCVAATLLFYDLFKPVSKRLSLVATLFGLLGSAVVAFASLFQIAALVVLKAAQHWSLMEPLQDLALMCLNMRAQAYNISLAFFGLQSLLVSYLILRATFLPRIVGVLMALAGLSWLTFLSPPLATQLSPYIAAPGFVGEGALALWLLVIGVNPKRWNDAALANAEDR